MQTRRVPLDIVVCVCACQSIPSSHKRRVVWHHIMKQTFIEQSILILYQKEYNNAKEFAAVVRGLIEGGNGEHL